MIYFDGIDLDSVVKVDIEDIRISGINYDAVSRSKSISPGAFLVRNRAAGRNITVTFSILQQDRISRQEALRIVNAWAKSDKEYKLELPNRPGMYIMAVCTEKPAISTRQWWERLRLVFSCISDPYFINLTEKRSPCNSPFMVCGDAEPIMRIQRVVDSPITTDTSYSMNGNTMTFSYIRAGTLVIDLSAQTAVSDGRDMMQYYKASSRFLVPQTGIQIVTGTGDVYWRERFE